MMLLLLFLRRREWCPLLLASSFALGGALCTPRTVSTFDTKECFQDCLFTEHVMFSRSARSALECTRFCTISSTCLTFTFARPLCQGHSEVMTPFSLRRSLSGAKTFVRRDAELTTGIHCSNIDGEQTVFVPGLGYRRVYCEGSWIVILRRMSGFVDFYLNWESYKELFGNFDSDFWLGLETVHWMTSPYVDAVSSSPWSLAVDLGDWEGIFTQAIYTNFSVGPEVKLYPLNINFSYGSAGDSMSWYSGVPFSTLDRDHDESNNNCAEKHHGAWWYKSCVAANLCGRYYTHSAPNDKDGITWKTWHGTSYSLKFAQLKIRMMDAC